MKPIDLVLPMSVAASSLICKLTPGFVFPPHPQKKKQMHDAYIIKLLTQCTERGAGLRSLRMLPALLLRLVGAC